MIQLRKQKKESEIHNNVSPHTTEINILLETEYEKMLRIDSEIINLSN